ncbi:MAG: DUF2887 domain-containing protein [Thermoguttaceae bacterium]
MKTDKELLKIFEAAPDWIFQLTGLPSPGSCTLRSMTIKSLERRVDAVLVPLAPDQPLTIVEFQFQWDEKVYTWVVMEMAAVQEMNSMRPVQGVIFFGYNKLDPRTVPWTAVVRSFVLQELLESLEQEQPKHPLVAVFKPLFGTSDEVVEREAVDYYLTIKHSELSADCKAALLDVLVSWLGQRFKHKGIKETLAMLLGELPPLEETQLGKELIQIGEQRGQEQGVQQGLEEAVLLFLAGRHSTVPAALEAKIRALSAEEAKRLLRYLYSPEPRTLEDVDGWLNAPPK